jgi:hypothetical protein
LELLLLFPFFMFKNTLSYSHSGLACLFNYRKDMFYRFIALNLLKNDKTTKVGGRGISRFCKLVSNNCRF